jgi:hypothetical protein
MKKKKAESKKITIEFDEKHLTTLTTALEVYCRLRSGQIKMAINSAFWDINLSYAEGQWIENVVRSIVFPPTPKREYDGHGGFYDLYDNEYDDTGAIIKEGEDWKNKKNRPHLDQPNASFGVGCKELKDGTAAWEIKKVITQYQNYQRNGGYRDMGVDGDGPLPLSGVPVPKIVDPIPTLSTLSYWRPQKAFRIPQRYQEKIAEHMAEKKFDKAWDIVDRSFKNKPLPRGASATIEEVAGTFYVVVKEPILPT